MTEKTEKPEGLYTTLSDRIRQDLRAETICTCCLQSKMTYVELASTVNRKDVGISDDLLSRFLKGGQIKSGQLDAIDAWLRKLVK